MAVTVVNVTTKSEITVVERIPLGPGSSDRTTDDGINTTQLKFTSTSASPMSAKSHFSQPLTSGSATIDLLALLDSANNTIASTGMRVQAIKVQNPNPNALAVAPAGSNGYGLTFTVLPQGELMMTSENLAGVIGSSAHLLTLTGTSAQVSNWMIVLG